MTIRLDQPRRFDLVGNPVMIAGIGTGFEAMDGSEINKVRRPVFLATRMVRGYIGYREHVVERGDTLTAIAREHYGTPNFQPIVRANAHQIDDPDLIFPGQVLRVPIGTG